MPTFLIIEVNAEGIFCILDTTDDLAEAVDTFDTISNAPEGGFLAIVPTIAFRRG